MGRNTESSLPECAMTIANAGTCNAHPGQGSRVRHRRLTHEAARTVMTQAGNLPDQRRNGRPDHDAEGFDGLSTRMAVALSSRGRMAGTPLAVRLTPVASSAERHAPYPGTGRPGRADVFRDPFMERGRGRRPPTGGPKRVLRLGASVAANVRRPFPENPSHLALSRAPQRDPSPAHIPRLCAA
jgi:hypothetical protein